MDFALLKRITVQDVVADKRILVEAEASESIGACLDLFTRFDILSLPVYAHDLRSGVGGGRRFVATVSVIDIALFLSENANDVKRSLLRPVKDLLCKTYESEQSLYHVVYPDTSVLEACKVMREGVHRLIVPEKSMGSNGNFVKGSVFDESFCRMLTQTDVLKTVAEHWSAYEDLASRKISDCHMIHRPVEGVNSDDKIRDAFRHMLLEGHSAVPVIRKGSLCGTLSASDIRVLGSDLHRLAALLPSASVQDFLDNIHGKEPAVTVVCFPNDSYRTVVDRMLSCRVHRLWVVGGKSGHVLDGVVSMTDAIRVLYAAHHHHPAANTRSHSSI
eukprot:Rmarinus@m.12167